MHHCTLPARLRLAAGTLAVVVPMLACSGGPDGESVGASKAAATPTYGVDYSFSRPSPSSIRAAGFTFVARYLSHESGKNLSAGEAQALIAAGLTIVCNWEDSATNSLSGYGQGVSDATAAKAQALADGQPSDRPIYFSVDFDANSGQLGTIESYFEGVASVIGISRTGVYGGHYIVNALFNDGKVAWGWQAYAWSYGQWDPRAQFRQIQNGIDNDEEDEDAAVAADFGQWPIAAPAPPPPQPARGSLDSVTCDQIGGWAQDPNTPGTAIPVDVYLDGPAGTGTALGRFTAGNDRSDLCSALGSCNHGFAIEPPTSLYDGHAHSVYAYGIAVTSGAANTLLTGSPKTLDCAAALTGNFDGSGSTEVVQFRDDWQTLPLCGRWGSDWSCDNKTATYLGGVGAGNAGTAVYGGGNALVGDANGDGRDDILQFNDGWTSLPTCFSTDQGWACENLDAHYVGGIGAGNSGSGIYPGATPFVADVNGDGAADIIQYNPGWQSLPVCLSTHDGWACENLEATYVAGLGAGNSGSGIYGTSFGKGTTTLIGDVNGDGKADFIQYNPGWASIPVCFSTGEGWSCENLKAEYVSGIGAGNAGSGIYGTAFGAATVLVADVNGDGKADLIQYSQTWESIPVCLATSHGWACENLRADTAGGTSGGTAATGIYPFGVPLTGTFLGGKASGIVQINPSAGWTTLPLCSVEDSGWSCSNRPATVY